MKAKKNEIPIDFEEALKKNKIAMDSFNSMPPSHKSEYIKWIEEAKKSETRTNRIKKAIERLKEEQKQK